VNATDAPAWLRYAFSALAIAGVTALAAAGKIPGETAGALILAVIAGQLHPDKQLPPPPPPAVPV
jgi:hypothetical protein